jgi:rubrerythrin/uncharacterized membrane protein
MAKWRCVVCGYVHEGDEPPEQCPVCGADRSRFTLVDDSGAAKPDPSPDTASDANQRWQCSVCGAFRTGAAAPEQCPVCGAEGSLFAPAGQAPGDDAAPSESDQSSPGEQLRWQCTICGYIHTGPEPPDVCPVCGADRSKFVRLDDPQPSAEPEKESGDATATAAADDLLSKMATRLDAHRRWIDMAIDYHAHPIAVHIPNGVLPVTVAMVLLAALFDWPMIGQAAVYNMAFIFLSMPVVLFTGYLHWQYKFGGNMTDLFKWKIICGGLVTGLALILFLWGLSSPETARDPGFIYLALHVIMLAAAGIAGWLGGKLVFNPNV